MVNGQGPFPFVVDTGANQSVVSDVLALQLGLPVGPSQALNGVAGVQQAPTTVATLKIGDRSHADVVLSMLPGRGDRRRRHIGARPDGGAAPDPRLSAAR